MNSKKNVTYSQSICIEARGIRIAHASDSRTVYHKMELFFVFGNFWLSMSLAIRIDEILPGIVTILLIMIYLNVQSR